MRDFLDVFDRLENEYEVTHWRCAGLYVWPLVKILLARELFTYVKEKNLVLLHGLGLRRQTQFAGSVVRREFTSAPVAPADVCLLTYNSFSQYQVDGRWFNIFQDPLVHFGGGLPMTTLEVLNTYPLRQPALHRTSAITLPVLTARFLSSRRRSAALRADIDRLLAKVDACREIIGSPAIEPLKASIATSVPYVVRLSEAYQRALERVAPRIGLLSCYYNLTGFAFCLACRRMGIDCADISHGSSGKEHYAYGGWNHSPAQGYELLPRDFLSRSERDARAPMNLVAGSSFHRQPRVVGDLAAHAWRANAFGIADAPRRSLDRVHARDGRLEALVALQDIRQVPENFLQAMRAMADRCFFWIRMHPVYATEAGRIPVPLEPGTFDIVNATQQPPFALLERVDAVITESSSVAEDALPWDAMPIVTHEVGRFLFSEYIEQGRMIFAPDAQALTAAITSLAGRRRAHDPGADSAEIASLQSYLHGSPATKTL
jgi:hypothetical protein